MFLGYILQPNQGYTLGWKNHLWLNFNMKTSKLKKRMSSGSCLKSKLETLPLNRFTIWVNCFKFNAFFSFFSGHSATREHDARAVTNRRTHTSTGNRSRRLSTAGDRTLAIIKYDTDEYIYYIYFVYIAHWKYKIMTK
jgi:hypothetical protein